MFTFFVVVTFNFWLFRVLPGNFTLLMARAGTLDPAAAENLKRSFGLDKSPLEQYALYLKNLVTLNWGTSYITGEPVLPQVLQAVMNTILLITVAYVLTILVGVLLGVMAGSHAGRGADSWIVTLSLALWSMPTFWLGLLLILLFSVWIGGLPLAGMETYGVTYTNGFDHSADVGMHLILPTLTLVVGSIAQYTLIMRNSLISVVDEDYVTTAKAKGLSASRVLWVHVVPNSLLPTFTLTWLNIGILLSATIQVETVFSWPGLGSLIYQSVNQRDYPVLELAFLTIAVVVIVANLLNDLLYPLMDPRIRRG
jgi:peptide/nickel transport system permease protein